MTSIYSVSHNQLMPLCAMGNLTSAKFNYGLQCYFLEDSIFIPTKNKSLNIARGNEYLTITKELVNDFKQLIKFAGDRDIREHLNALYFDSETKKVIATDGHRLLLKELDFSFSKSVIMPLSFIKQILRIFASDYVKRDITVLYNPNAKGNNLTVTYMDGMLVSTDLSQFKKYPDYKRVLPRTKPNTGSFSLSKTEIKQFKDIARKVKKQITSFEKYAGVKLSNGIEFPNDNENTNSFTFYPIEDCAGEFKTSVNFDYLMDFPLGRFYMSDSFTGIYFEGNGFIGVVMPMRL